MNLSLIEAFGKFRAKPRSRLGALSATATHTKSNRELLGQHLTLARNGALPIRMVVAPAMKGERGGESRRRL